MVKMAAAPSCPQIQCDFYHSSSWFILQVHSKTDVGIPGIQSSQSHLDKVQEIWGIYTFDFSSSYKAVVGIRMVSS